MSLEVRLAIGGTKRSAALSLITVLFVLASASAIVGALAISADQRRSAYGAEQAARAVAVLDGLEWQAIAQGRITSEQSPQIKAAQSQFKILTARLVQTSMEGHRQAVLLASVRDYEAAIRDEFAALSSRNIALARRLDRIRVDPAFDRAQTQIDADAKALRTSASNEALLATILAALIAPFTVLFTLLFWRREQAQRQSMIRSERAIHARFEAMVTNATDLLAITDTEGLMIYRSPSFEGVLGRDPKDRISLATRGNVHPDDYPQVAVALDRVVSQPGGRLV